MATKSRYTIISRVCVLAFLLITLIVSTAPVLAATNADIIKEKSLLYGLARCYTTGAIKSSMSVDDYTKLGDLIENKQQYVKMPTGYASSNMPSCPDVLKEALSSKAPSKNDGASAINSFLESIGYKDKQSGSTGRCVTFTYNVETTTTTLFWSNVDTNSSWSKICAPTVNSDGTISVDKMDVTYGGSYGDGSGGYSDILSVDVGNKYVQLDCSNYALGNGGCGKHTFTPGSTKWDNFVEELYADLYANNRSGSKLLVANELSNTMYSYELDSNHPNTDYSEETEVRSFSDATAAANKAIQTLSNYLNISKLQLSERERITMLQDFLDTFWNIDNYGCGLSGAQVSGATTQGYSPISMYVEGKAQTCYVKPTANIGRSVNGYAADFYPSGAPMTFEEVVGALKGALGDLTESDKQRCNDTAESSRRAAQNLLNQSTTSEEYRKKANQTIAELDKILADYGEYWKEENGVIICYSYTDVDGQVVDTTPPPIDGEPEPPSSSTSGSSANPTSDIAQCLNNASSLGWILCPVLKFVGVAADGLWNEVANNWLVTDYTTYKADKNNSVYVAWSNIRNLTNIVFAIMLGIIIVSQLTGVGISNYGIKKILPTLVMTIVLVNISFLICQLLIDVSNVIGGSVESIADTMRQQISEASGVGFGDIFRGTLGSLFNIAGIGILSGAAFYTISTEGAAVLIPLLIAVIGVIISIIFAFVILAVRQAIILVSVVISPLAIICYALPNTKSLYDKWRKIFTTSLFIYPVCAVCIYGGQVVSSLMLASNHTGFMYNLVAMLLQIVPIFFIPSLIRGAMALAGNIGNRVAQMGNNLRNSTTGSLSKSDTAERLRMEGQYQAAQRNRGLFDRLSQRKGLLGAIGRAGGRKLDSNIGKYNEMRLKDYQSQLYASNPRSLTTALSAAKQNHIDKLAKDIALENTDIATNDGALQVKHAEALAAYNANQTEENLASVQAYQDMLIESGDGGRQLMFDNYARAAQSGLGTALRDGAKHAIRAHSKDIKSNNRDMYAMLTQYAGGGDLMAGSFRPYTDAKGSEHMISSHFANKGIESYDAQSLAKMDEGSLDRLVEQARHKDLSTVAEGKLESLTHEAITNKTISIQGKIEDKLNDLREAMGYERISRRKSDDSGTINVHSGDSGTVLRTGNDDRPTSPASTAPTTAIPGYREAQNWRPNADASGIILPPGFKK